MNEYLNNVYDGVATYLTEKGLNLLLAIIVLVIGLWVVKVVVNLIERAMKRSKSDATLNGFVKGLVSISLKIILIISAAGIAGFPTTTFITVLGAASVAVGFALKDSLSNLAGGLIILAFRPYRVGDFIEFNGVLGTLTEIGLMFSALNTIDNKRVTIPNGELVTAKVTNYSAEDARRIEIAVRAPYSESSDRIKHILMDVAMKNDGILVEPAPFCGILEFGESAVQYTFRAWVPTSKYLTTYFELMEAIKKRFDEEKIDIPFKQVDVHVSK